MEFQDEFFGSEAKVALMRRSADLWQVTRSSPRYAYYGRLVALSDPAEDAPAILKALARMQGAGVAYYFPKELVAPLFAELESDGFKTDRHEHYYGGSRAYEAAKRVVQEHALPPDLSVVRLDSDTPGGLIKQVAELCQSCDVMPVPGAVMRGVALPGINLVALDGTGTPVASASSFVLHHPDSPKALDMFWGALATRPDRRGQKIALVLGAMAIVHMWEVEGARGFMTGVRQDNRSSHKLCVSLGVEGSEWIYAHCLHTELLGDSSVTR